MKKTISLFLMSLVALIMISINSYSQANQDEFSTIYFCRAKQGMMSGGTSMNVKIKINDQEISNLGNGTQLSYKVYSEGVLNLFCEGEFSGSPIGSPFVATLEVSNGNEYCVDFSAGMTGIKGKILDGKNAKKAIEAKYNTEFMLEEDKDKPLVK